MWATRSRIDFRSLRWRIAGSYAALLTAAIVLIAVVLTIELRGILLDEARSQTDRVGGELSSLVRGQGTLLALGEPATTFEHDILVPGNLERWSSPTTFVEIDRGDGYLAGKSGNLGSAKLDASPKARAKPLLYGEEANPVLGPLFVRDEYVRFADGSAIIIKIAQSLAIYDQTVARVRALLAIVAAIAALVLLVASALLAKSAVEPIDRLTRAMREIGSEQLSRRIGWTRRHDEIGELAATFDDLLERLEQAFARERQFISDASHELKTPLTIINANAQMLERWGDRDPEILRDSLRAIREESGALAGMVGGMLLLAKAESGDAIPSERVDLDVVAAEAARNVEPRAHDKGLSLRLEPARVAGAAGPLVVGDPNLLRQLITNLVDNAIKFTEQGGIVVRIAAPDAATAEIAVTDSGVGIEAAVLERVFDRFFRADRAHDRAVEGTGLGLAIVRSIARVHGGTVAAERNAGAGTTFRVRLPRIPEDVSTPSLIAPS